MGLARAALPQAAIEDAPTARITALDDEPVEPEAARVTIVRGWLESIGPVTAAALATRLGIAASAIAVALARLEGEGVVLQGRFTPSAAEVEWCERRLLARIHRLTIGHLRREIDPVQPADFLRFLFRWQHLVPGTRLHRRDGVAAIITQLHGLELPAPAWEHTVLPSRLEGYEPGFLDELCLAGVVAWGRFSPLAGHPDDRAVGSDEEPAPRRRRAAPTRVAPLALALRDDLAPLLAAHPAVLPPGLSHAARTVAEHLAAEGASFIGDIARATGLLPVAAEDALWELVARGLVTGDGFAGLRALLAPADTPRPERRLRALRGGRAPRRALPVGRWALLRAPKTPPTAEALVESAARRLLRRYGVVVRELLARETLVPPWRTLLGVYRRLEARGEIRGGRFVAGLVGEQFALPEAVEALRATRRESDDGQPVLLGAADPLNLVGILTPGPRVSPLSGQVIAFERGVPVDTGELGAVRSRLRGRALADD